MTANKILLVDDEADILRSTQMLLEVLGYECAYTHDPDQVASLARKENPDLILHDLRMPGADVEATMRALRADPATARIPVAFFSASPNLSDQAAELDAAGFLTKPFRVDELRALLERIIGTPAQALKTGV